MPPDPVSLVKNNWGRELIRLFFKSSGDAHALRHEQRKKIVSGLGLMDQNGVQSIHQRLDNLEGELRRLGLLNDED